MFRLVVVAALLVAVYCQGLPQPRVQPVIGTPRSLQQTIAVRGRTNAACQTTCTGGGICVKEKNCNDQQYAIGCYFCVDPNTLPCLSRMQIEEFLRKTLASTPSGPAPPRSNNNRGDLFSPNRPFTNMLLMEGLGFF